jgi:phosphoenolpyruvate carboxylase
LFDFLLTASRLWQTREVLHQCLVNPSLNVKQALEETESFLDVNDLFEPLKVMYDSLVSTGDESTANNMLLDMLRQVQRGGAGGKGGERE